MPTTAQKTRKAGIRKPHRETTATPSQDANTSGSEWFLFCRDHRRPEWGEHTFLRVPQADKETVGRIVNAIYRSHSAREFPSVEILRRPGAPRSNEKADAFTEENRTQASKATEHPELLIRKLAEWGRCAMEAAPLPEADPTCVPKLGLFWIEELKQDLQRTIEFAAEVELLGFTEHQQRWAESNHHGFYWWRGREGILASGSHVTPPTAEQLHSLRAIKSLLSSLKGAPLAAVHTPECGRIVTAIRTASRDCAKAHGIDLPKTVETENASAAAMTEKRGTYSVSEAAALVNVTNETWNVYAKMAGVPTAKKSKKDFRLSRSDVSEVITYMSKHGKSCETKDVARVWLTENPAQIAE